MVMKQTKIKYIIIRLNTIRRILDTGAPFTRYEQLEEERTWLLNILYTFAKDEDLHKWFQG